MSKEQYMAILSSCKETLQEDFGIVSLRLFGSTAVGKHGQNSDVDVFVDTKTPNPFLLMQAKDYLEEKTGCPVDIVRNHQNLNPRLRKRIDQYGITIF